MASVIDTVYANLDATTVNVSGTVPTVYTLAELKEWTDIADLPCRLLLPVNERNQASAFELNNFGHTQAEVTWRITDLLLWKNVNTETGLKDVAAELLEYSKEYLEMLLTFVPAAGSPAWFSNATSTIDIFEWPEDSGQYFWGVEVVLTLTEHI